MSGAACSPTRSTRPPTSCSARPTSCPSAATSCPTSSRPGSSPAASTSATPGRALFPEPEALLGDAPLLLGTDGEDEQEPGNAIAHRATSADETARLIRRARRPTATGTSPTTPQQRPEVANLAPARRAVPGAARPRTSPRRSAAAAPGAQAPGHRGGQRAVPRHPRAPRRADRRSRPPAPGPPRRDGAGAGDRRRHAAGGPRADHTDYPAIGSTRPAPPRPRRAAATARTA